MNKEEREERERMTTYRVCSTFGRLSNAFLIEKRILDVTVDRYHVSIQQELSGEITSVWCDCPGFRMQKYAHLEHKHIKLVLDFQQRGEPTWAEYGMAGTGQKAVITFLNQGE